MEHPKDVGDQSTLAIMAALRFAGFAMYVPFGENTRTDLVIEQGTELSRVQCKTGRLREGAVRFNACSTYAHHRNPPALQRDYLDEVDYFGVYCPQTGGVYLVPIEDMPVRSRGALRVEPSRNGQKKRIRLASDCQIGKVKLERSTAEPGASSDAGESSA